MLAKTRAIVLHSIKYGETSIIANLYTEEFGRLSLIARGIRKKSNKLKPTLFEVLSLLDIDIYRKKTQDLNNLKEAKSIVVLHHLYTNIRKSSVAIFLGELLYKTLREEERNPPLFNFLLNSIQILDIADDGIENYPLVFLIQLSKFLGIYPKNNSELAEYRTTEGIQISEIMDYTILDINRFKISGNQRNELMINLLAYYSDHLEGIGKLKSLQILREVYH
jgi:DNA repair protein RecO (recombination protein O)